MNTDQTAPVKYKLPNLAEPRSAVGNRDENSKPFSIRKVCRLTPKWRKVIFKSLTKGLKSQYQ